MEEENTTQEEKNDTKNVMYDEVLTSVENYIHSILEGGLADHNVDLLYKLVDIHKDICNEKYWKVKESEIMRYDNYSGYGYNNYGREQYSAYNRRGVDRRYRGHDYMDGMYDAYGRYEEGREQYNRGNYGAKDDTLRSLAYMLESAKDFFHMLKSEANSQEEMQMIREYAKKISEM